MRQKNKNISCSQSTSVTNNKVVLLAFASSDISKRKCKKAAWNLHQNLVMLKTARFGAWFENSQQSWIWIFEHDSSGAKIDLKIIPHWPGPVHTDMFACFLEYTTWRTRKFCRRNLWIFFSGVYLDTRSTLPQEQDAGRCMPCLRKSRLPSSSVVDSNNRRKSQARSNCKKKKKKKKNCFVLWTQNQEIFCFRFAWWTWLVFGVDIFWLYFHSSLISWGSRHVHVRFSFSWWWSLFDLFLIHVNGDVCLWVLSFLQSLWKCRSNREGTILHEL